ncbi:uncharacterized protein TM35_000181250 [Trypanosoma theileri]|uniref:Uncharacterized protein n=1 Tax=Trypanosoma theileri TaxID=67003 RepID=A0A1X0NU52_9TRYP|nr:uncharacterized protein TM35_000181250 [Trypanosoma theileri]ORC88068.1 hypothetical protein TM35_000181250 [Trypanosoma theileri]
MTDVVLTLDRLEPVPSLSGGNNCVVSVAVDTESSRDKISSSRDAGCSSSTFSEKCCCHYVENDGSKEGKESDVATYISIINAFQEKVNTLQKALLTANQCAVLSRTTELSGESLSTNEKLQEKNSRIKGQSTRRRRTEWTQATDANNAMNLLEQVSSNIHPDDFERWKKDSDSPLLDNVNTNKNSSSKENVIQKDKKQVEKNEEFEHFVISSCPTTEELENSSNLNGVFVDPVILVDITAVMANKKQEQEQKKEQNSLPKECNCSVKQSTICEEMERVNSENVKLREMYTEAQRKLETRNEEIRVQKVQLEELQKRVEELSQCKAKMQKEFAALQSQHDEAMKLKQLSEAKVRDTTMMMESINASHQAARAECEEAKRDAEAAWKEVRRLEKELREWSQKERELQRLRILMRFSELKKDSDKLSTVAEEIEFLSNERQRLHEENRRCRTLLSEYRLRLEQKEAESSSIEIQSSCNNVKSIDTNDMCKPAQEKDELNSSVPCVSRRSQSQVRNTVRAPSRPASALRVREESHRRSTQQTKSCGASGGKPPLAATSAFPQGDGSVSSLFERRGRSPNRHQNMMSSQRPKSCKGRSILF